MHVPYRVELNLTEISNNTRCIKRICNFKEFHGKLSYQPKTLALKIIISE